SHGSWQYATDGVTWNALGTVAPGSARLLMADADTRVRFVPAADFNGNVPAALTFLAWDGSNGQTEGALADTTTGSSAYSAASATASISVTPVNDAPVLDGQATTLSGMSVNQLNTSGTLVSTLLSGHTSDVDGDSVGIAITAADNGHGSWQYTRDGGST